MNNDPLKHFLKKGDLEPPIRRQIIHAATGLPYDLTGASAKFIMRKDDAAGAVKINAAAVIESPPTSGTVRYDWQGTDTDTAGDYVAEFEITLLSSKKITFPAGEFDPGKSYITVKITTDLGD